MAAVRAVVEIVMPPRPGRSGTSDLGLERHVAEAIDRLLPGFVTMAAMLLDAYAAELRPGSSFADLPPEERDRILRSMAGEESQDIQDLIGALLLFTVAGMYNEWTGYDRATGRLVPPDTWPELGFAGPSTGFPAYRDP